MFRAFLPAALLAGLAALALAQPPEAQAPAPTPAAAVVQALADAKRLPADVQPHVRYLSAYHLAAAQAQVLGPVLSFAVNQVSREAELVPPAQVAPGLWRINLKDYRIDPVVWEKFADAGAEPYFHAVVVAGQDTLVVRPWPGGVYHDGKLYERTAKDEVAFRKGSKIGVAAPWLPAKEAGELGELLYTQAPVVRADWFLVQAGRQLSLRNRKTGFGYYDFLGLKSRNDYFRLIRLDERASLDVGREVRAALDRSGVSQQNRQIVRLQALTGGAWFTLDTDDEADRGNAVRNLRRGDYLHKAEEWYAPLPNGLPAYLASDDKGVLQDSVPDFIGPDDSPLRVGRDGRIHPGIGCIRCHGGQVLRPIDDWARRTFRNGLTLQSADYDLFRALQRQYLSNLDRALERDRLPYQEAMRDASGLEAGKLVDAYARAYNLYVDTPLTADALARELGTDGPRLLAALRQYQRATGNLDLVLAGLLSDPPSPLTRVHAEDVYPLAQTVLRGYVPAP